MAYVDPGTFGTPGPGTIAKSAWADAVQTDIELFANYLPPAASLQGTQYVTTSGNDSHDGLTWGSAKATVAAASSALSGGGVVELGAGSIAFTSAAPPAGVTIRGRGRGLTTLAIASDAGSGHKALDCSASTEAAPIVLEAFTLQGPGSGNFTIGTAPANMDGVFTGSNMQCRNFRVLGFRSGIVVQNSHEQFYTTQSTNNYYNVYNTTGNGNQVFYGCDLTGATRASLVASGAGTYDACSFINTHVGFAPVGLFKEATTTNAGLISDSWADLPFEQCANACIYHVTPTNSDRTISNVAFFDPFFRTVGVGTYFDASLPTAAAVNVSGGCYFTCVRDQTNTAGSATTVFNATGNLPSVFVTDRLPLANDCAGSWLGSEYAAPFFAGQRVKATIVQAAAAVTQGQVVQIQGSSAVKPFGSDNSFSYLGVAAFNAASSAQLAVYVEGACQVLCTQSIPFYGIRLEIDPGTPAQVRPVNTNLGVGVAPASQPPGQYPVIGVSNGGNGGANTLTPIWLYGPAANPAYCSPGQVSALPGASSTYKGQMLIVPGNGSTTADILYVCLLSAAGSYSWKQIVSG